MSLDLTPEQLAALGEKPHTEHVTVDAYHPDCLEGECDHESDRGELENCAFDFEVCVDCMVAKGAGRDEEGWDDIPLSPWPHGSTL